MAIALVTSTSKAAGGTTPNIDTSGASILVAAVGWTSATIQAPVLTDNKGNLWTIVAVERSQTTASLAVYVAINPTVGSGHNFSITGSTSTICVAAFSGTATSFPTSKSISAAQTTVTTIQPGSLTPEVNNCVMIAALCSRSTGSYSIDSSFTIAVQEPFATSVQMGVGLAYLVETTAAAKNPTWTQGSSTTAAAAQAYIQPPVSSAPYKGLRGILTGGRL